MWIVVPVVIVGSIILLLAWIFLGWICYHKWIVKCRRTKEANQRNNDEKIAKEKEKQKEEATKLTRMQLEMEEIELGKMYANNQTDFSITPSNSDRPNIFIVPGATVEPLYPDVNPYSGHHNTNIIPLVYDTKCYGVTYDIPQNTNVPTLTPQFSRNIQPIIPVSVSHSDLSKSDSFSDNHKIPDQNRHLSNQV